MVWLIAVGAVILAVISLAALACVAAMKPSKKVLIGGGAR
jgi:hypothetical protein